MTRTGEARTDQRPHAPKSADDGADTDKPAGLECRKCGCRHFEVVWVRPMADGTIHRSKSCRNCGWRIRTKEKIAV